MHTSIQKSMKNIYSTGRFIPGSLCIKLKTRMGCKPKRNSGNKGLTHRFFTIKCKSCHFVLFWRPSWMFLVMHLVCLDVCITFYDCIVLTLLTKSMTRNVWRDDNSDNYINIYIYTYQYIYINMRYRWRKKTRLKCILKK